MKKRRHGQDPGAGRSYAIIGTGALGGFYGALLHRAGIATHFLLHSDYEHVKPRGLRLDSPLGRFHFKRVHAYARTRDMPVCDVVVIALKTTRNHILAKALPPIVGPRTTVVTLQNGLGIEDDIARIVGPERVVGGLSFLCSNKVGPGHIRHLDYGSVMLAEYRPDGHPGGITPRLRAIAADFRRAGVTLRLAGDLVLARWKKLVWNIPYNGLSVALQAQTDELMADPDARRLVEELMEEVVAGAAAVGRRIPRAFVRKMLRDTERMKPYRTSMKIDFDSRRPIEVEAILGAPLRAARKAGARLPKIETLYRLLCFLDRRNRDTDT